MAEELARKLECMSCKENLPPNFRDLLKSRTISSEDLELQRRKLLEAVEAYVGNDPLKPWVRFVRWAKDLCTPGVKSELIPLLELCTQKFLNDPRYADDQRYLRLWIRYADCCSEPLSVFSFLEAKSIGRSHSLFYEAYAVILELRMDFDMADKIYQLGISRNAQPLPQLHDMYKKFLRRKEQLPLVRQETSSGAVQSTFQEKMTVCIRPQERNEVKHDGNLSGEVSRQGTVQEAVKEPCRGEAVASTLPQAGKKHAENLSSEEANALQNIEEGSERFTVPPGDETIAIRKYAQDVLVLGIDAEAANPSTESHHGLVDPTINTKEAMANVLSFFNQPLPFEQIRKPRKERAAPSSGRSNFDVFVDDRYDDSKAKDPTSTAAGNSDFSFFMDEEFKVEKGDTQSKTGNSGFDIFVDEEFEQSRGDNSRIASASSMFVDEENTESKRKTSTATDFPAPGRKLTLKEVSQIGLERPVAVATASAEKTSLKEITEPIGVDPWNAVLIEQLLKGLQPSLSTYKGFHLSSKKYSGTVSLSTLKSSCRNKSLELGHSTYHIKGCTGQGAFAQVYQAHDDYDKTVVLKIQRPPCPWEFYIYRQLDKRIPDEERSSFGYAWKMHVYSDCSIMVADYGQHGTLQDVINSYLAQGQKMDELLCIYYTIEMLRMLEVLHAQGLIHGDFKPDNLLIRNESENWEDWDPTRPGCWKDQGLCLIDWGASIDMNLFASGTKLTGDCKTSAFRCTEMIQGRPWTFQVDTYGLCCIVHCMLHGNYMEIQESQSSSEAEFKPKAPLKRYWNASLWESLFTTLLNVKSCESNPPLGPLRRSLEDHMLSNASYPRKLKELLMKQTVMMYSRK